VPGGEAGAVAPSTADPPRGTGAGAAPDPRQQALSPRIDAVLVAIGFMRLRPGKAYDPALLRDLEAARADLQGACVSRRD
jgi:hypothetical protein